MSFNSQQLVEQFADLVSRVYGEHAEFDRVDGVASATASSLVFARTVADVDSIKSEPPSVLVTSQDVAEVVKPYHHGLIICVDDVKLAQARMKQVYQDHQAMEDEWDAIHRSAVIHQSAKLGRHVRVGPNVVIGARCRIGDNTTIRANSVIEHDAVIGTNCIINALVNIGYDCELGDNVIIHSGCVIGNEGFGFAQDSDSRSHRIPHTGKVVIHDDVQIGSNSNVDRATYGQTTIERGVKIDALCHIAHNVHIKEDSILAAQSVIAGSSTIGKRVLMSGQCGVLDHKTICDDAVLVHRCGVTQDITQAGIWAGIPAKPWRDYVQDVNLAKKVKKLEKIIKQQQQSGA